MIPNKRKPNLNRRILRGHDGLKRIKAVGPKFLKPKNQGIKIKKVINN